MERHAWRRGLGGRINYKTDYRKKGRWHEQDEKGGKDDGTAMEGEYASD